MKDLKTELKEFQKEIKELKNHPEEAMAVQKKAMETNMKYMSHSMKSTLFTIIPVIIIFGWANANLAFDPILPNQEFTVEASFARGATGTISLIVPEGIEAKGNLTRVVEDGKVVWVLKGEEGDYVTGKALQFEFNDEIAYRDVIITTEQRYAKVMESVRGIPGLKMIKIGNEQKKIVNMPFRFLGYGGGWLGTYIMFSMIFSMILRKRMKVY
jgi:uncharacterized membrane protein (DUF106 family)